MYVNRHNKVTKQFGFGLWELSIVMLIMIGLFVALINIMPMIVKRDNVQFDNSIVIKVDEQILGFIATYNRLPCPASSNTGLENCGVNSGSIPYKTLGLNEDYAGIGSIPIAYAVFRNPVGGADLSNITDLFNPTDSHGTVTTLNHVNGLDFCTALSNAKATAFSTAFAHIILPSGVSAAVPYVVVTAGITNADGDVGGNAFDGRNATSAMDFEAPNKNHDSNYDDTVFSKSFDELASTLNCDTAQNSLNLLADAKATHEENVAQAESIKGNAELAGIITGIQIVIGIANTAVAVATLVNAGIAVAGASVQLSAAIAACIASLGTACGVVAPAVAALVASVVAVVAAGVSVAANVAALIAQGIALAMVIDVANRAGSTVSIPEDSTDPVSGATGNNADLAAQARAQAEEFKKDAAEKVIAARDSIVNARSLAVSIRNRFNTVNTLAANLVASNAPVNDPAFTSYADSAKNQAQINVNQGNTTINNLSTGRNFANLAVGNLGTPVNSGFPAFINSYPNPDFPTAEDNLEFSEPSITLASNEFSSLNNSYLNTTTHAVNARTRADELITANVYPTPVDPLNPTAAEITAINNWSARNTILQTAKSRAQALINYMDEVFTNPFDANFLEKVFRIWIGIELGRMFEAEGNTTEALETITAALDAEENAAYFEANVGSGNPNPTTNVNSLSTGVEAILREADNKGVQR